MTIRNGMMAALCVSVLVLTLGCGGGGDDGAQRDLQAQVDLLMDERDAALQAEVAAEAAQAAAEAAQATAEMERDNANVAKGAAEELMRVAQQAQEDAETARQAAEDAKTAADMAQQGAETARDAALKTKTQAEDDLAAANASKTMTEGELAMVRQQLADAKTALATANTALATANDNLGTANDNLGTAKDDLDTAIKERDDAKDAEQQAKVDLARVQGQLDQARLQLTQAERDVADAEQEADQARAEADRRITEAEQQANVSLRAQPLLTALDLADGDEEVVVVEHVPGKSRKFAPTGSYARGSAAPSISGWHRASFSRLRGNDGTETAYLYTNIGSPSGKHFWKVYGEDVVESDSDFLTNAKPSGFGMQARKLFPDDREGNPDNKDNASRGGTYDGYSGTFSCATGCNIEAADGGALTFTGDWTFKARHATTGGTSMQDTEYLYFGIWAFDPKTPSGAHEFEWIAGGGGDIDNTHFRALTGTATFNGGAVGKYVLRNQVGQKDSIGTFTATATFTANFVDSPTLDGRITDFREGGSSLAGWSVYLGMSSSEAATLSETGAMGQANASIGGVSAMGNWAASLHGSNNPGHTDFGDGDNQIECPVSAGCPSADLAGVAGWFDAFSEGTAANSDAAIAGAFAAAP